MLCFKCRNDDGDVGGVEGGRQRGRRPCLWWGNGRHARRAAG